MHSRLTRSTAFAWARAAGLASSALAQIGVADRAVPGTYAITNARIVPVSGPTINRGTIVIRGGLIVAVGANVQAPADARVIDGSGLCVFPGFLGGTAHSYSPTRRRFAREGS